MKFIYLFINFFLFFIRRELHDLRFNKTYQTNSFVEVKNIRCIKGKYPDKLLQLWDAYDEKKNSENDSPRMFTDDQLYIALELGNGGQDMEAFVFNNSAEAYITFVQVITNLSIFLYNNNSIKIIIIIYRLRWRLLLLKSRWTSSTATCIGVIF